MPLALKGEVKKALATIAISLISMGGAISEEKLPILSKNYTSPTKLNLTNQIPKTNYLTTGSFGINLILAKAEGELELTDMKFAL
ncbi:MAG: hypothetical protein V7L04_07530 [Nostoc sp.]|uniref:hypothetical protein n=1 Tax=Nostoc sp. TaxID=1180 RepID=UPI002FF5E2C5